MPQPADTLEESRLAPLREAPDRTAIFCDVDGTLAPIVERAEDAHVPEKTSRLLGALGRRYALVACISGRSATEARRLVGVGSIAYAGSHGAELLEPGASNPTVMPAWASWAGRVRRFALERDTPELRKLRLRIEDKGPIMAFHWRGAPDEEAARTRLEGIAQEAEAAGLFRTGAARCWRCDRRCRWTRAVPCRSWCAARACATRCSAGDDATDLDGFEALATLAAAGSSTTTCGLGCARRRGRAGSWSAPISW